MCVDELLWIEMTIGTSRTSGARQVAISDEIAAGGLPEGR